MVEQGGLDAADIGSLGDNIPHASVAQGSAGGPEVHDAVALYFGQAYEHGDSATTCCQEDTGELAELIAEARPRPVTGT